jgi:hypothetical protein
MKTRLVRSKAKGQSLPLIGLMIVVLFAMVGLAVDVGNTYAEQRSVVRASNAASLVGMNTYLNGGNDADIRSAIVASLQSNNVRVAAPLAEPQPGERELQARYLDSSGNWLQDIGNLGSGQPPSGTSFIEVNVEGKVDTYFARVVGQQNFPVGAKAFSSHGPCQSGVYPLAIDTQTLNDSDGFKNPDSRYSDNVYRNKTQKRIFLKDNTQPNGSFSWLRWGSANNEGNAGELAAMWTGDGNIDEGFDEAPWPNGLNGSGSTSLVGGGDGYPSLPNQLSVDDWIYGNSGFSGSNDVNAAIDAHINNRTIVNFPIFNADNGLNGSNPAYHITALGAFIIRDFGFQNQRDANGFKGWYIDLVYIGEANECPILITDVPQTTNLGIAGNVQFRPRHYYVPDLTQPIQYLIILDVSGSMSWNFEGQTGNSNNRTQCTGVALKPICSSQGWSPTSERRVYIAKQAIHNFIDKMGTNDSMRIVSYSGNLDGNYSDSNAIRDLTKSWPTTGWSSNKTTLKDAVLLAGAQNNDPYYTRGGTPSATGIASANQVLSSAPTSSGGRDYKRVVIFLTDGVANIFKNGEWFRECGSEIASCQLGYTNGRAKPITAMANEAANLKQLATIYAVAFAGVDETGLQDVASAPNYPYFSSANQPDELRTILDAISRDVKGGNCVPSGGTTFLNTITDDRVGTVGSVGPQTYPTVGYVYLYDNNGNPLPAGKDKAPIMVDPQTGTLSYRFSDLTPNTTYQMAAFVAYEGDDTISRSYDQIFNPNLQSTDTRRSFTLQSAGSLGQVVPMEPLYLDMNGSVCPAN